MRRRIELALGMHEYELNRGCLARERIFELVREPRVRVVGLIEGGFGPGEYCFVVLHRPGANGSMVFWGLGLSRDGVALCSRWRWAHLQEVPEQAIAKRQVVRVLRRRMLAFPDQAEGLSTKNGTALKELRMAKAVYAGA